MTAIIQYHGTLRDRLMSLALDGITSPHTVRAYSNALNEFLNWVEGQPDQTVRKALVQGYKAMLIAKHLAPSSINVRLAAVRRLAQEAADNGLLDEKLAMSISHVRGVKRYGVRLGRWMDKASVEDLMETLPDTTRGKRDRALVASLVGAGLRRDEAATIIVEQFRMIQGRWAIVDLIGKGGRVRTVPIPLWVKAAIDAWLTAANVSTGKVFRCVRRNGGVTTHGLSGQTVYDVVCRYVLAIDPQIRPHDLRRSFARLAHDGKAPLEQLSLTLGHSSAATTERYVGARQDFEAAPCDVLGLDIEIRTSVLEGPNVE